MHLIPHESESEENEKNDDKDKEVAMLIRRFQRFLKKDKTFSMKPLKRFYKKNTGKKYL